MIITVKAALLIGWIYPLRPPRNSRPKHASTNFEPISSQTGPTLGNTCSYYVRAERRPGRSSWNHCCHVFDPCHIKTLSKSNNPISQPCSGHMRIP